MTLTHVQRLRALADLLALDEEWKRQVAAREIRECAAELERVTVELATLREVHTQTFAALQAALKPSEN